jgi:hypothetical protein
LPSIIRIQDGIPPVKLPNIGEENGGTMYVSELAELCSPDTQFGIQLPDGHYQMLRDPSELADYYGKMQIASISIDHQYGCIEIVLE